MVRTPRRVVRRRCGVLKPTRLADGRGLPAGLLRQLLAVRQSTLLGSSLADQMGVLAWQADMDVDPRYKE